MRSFGSFGVVSLVHSFFSSVIEPGDIVIDATCGNGKDALVISRLLQGRGGLFLYDIQEEAIKKAKNLLFENLPIDEFAIISFHCSSHVRFFESSVDLVTYNLGYLPGGDRRYTTLSNTTVLSLENATEILKAGGHIVITCYPGHPEGERELIAVENFVSRLHSKKWTVVNYRLINRNKAPVIFCISRNSSQKAVSE